MNEQQWLAATDPQGMLDWLRQQRKLSDRKTRLFACACVRRIWPLLTDERSRQAVEVAERFADGLASNVELHATYQAAEDAACDQMRCVSAARADAANAGCYAVCPARRYELAATDARNAAAGAASEDQATSEPSAPVRAWIRAKDAEATAQADLARCIFRNPFVARRPVQAAWLKWQDATVLRMATGIYEEPAFGRMPLLRDALMDAGCDEEAVLAHCREQGAVHAKGCWVIDLLMGKS